MRLPQGAKLQIILAGAITTNQLHYDAAWSDNPGGADGQQGLSNSGTAVDVVPQASGAAGIRRDVDFFSIYNNDTVAATVTIQQVKGSTTTIVNKCTMDPGDTFTYSRLDGWRKNNLAGILGFTSTTDASTADSKAVSAGTRASVADSKAVSSSTVDSTNLSVTNSKDVSQSVLISAADSKGVSASGNASSATSAVASSSLADSASFSTQASNNLSQSVLISASDSKDLSQSVLISALTSRVSSKGG